MPVRTNNMRATFLLISLVAACVAPPGPMTSTVSPELVDNCGDDPLCTTGGTGGSSGDGHECKVNCSTDADCNDGCAGLWTCERSHGGGVCWWADFAPTTPTSAREIPDPGWQTNCDPSLPPSDPDGCQGSPGGGGDASCSTGGVALYHDGWLHPRLRR